MLFNAALAASTLTLAAAQISPYAPVIVECPAEFEYLRTADGVSPSEAAWLAGKDNATRGLVGDFLANSGLQDLDAERYVENSTIRIGVAVSGGGYRAMLTGAGVLEALDSRTASANSTGSLAGLLNAATYLSGLSGGGWLVASLAGNNFSTVRALQESPSQWEFSNLFEPTNTTEQNRTAWFETLAQYIYEKRLSGFNTSLTDLWGLGLGAQLLGGRDLDFGANTTLSGLAELPPLTSYDAPLPILVADHAESVTAPVALNSTVLEFNPFEVGSWDPSLRRFAATKYLGTPANNGTTKQCVSQLDNLAFTLGTSSSLFNLPTYGIVGSIVTKALPIDDEVSEYDELDLEVAVWNPNPFNGTSRQNSSISGEQLFVVDGGENGEGIPLQPLIRPERNVDIVFAVDAASDAQGFPDGSSLQATFRRQFTSQGDGVKFPYVPTPREFASEGLLGRPTFFGVDARNLSSLWNSSVPEDDRVLPPVIVYLPNAPYTFPSNISTLDIQFDNKVRDGMIANGEAIATQNGTVADWRPCVACAIIVREQQRRGEQPSEQCQQCFQKYAWPPINGTRPSANATSLFNSTLLH